MKFRLKHTLTFYTDVDTDDGDYASDDPNEIAVEHTEMINNGITTIEDLLSSLEEGDDFQLLVEATYATTE